MPSTTLYLIRHGQVEKARPRSYHGQSDVPLSSLGRRQMDRLVEWAKSMELSAVYCSDLQRAQQGAEAVARECAIPLSVTPVLREKHFGRAAEACGVTQPTLSAGVKQLEEQMGVLLVNRGSRFQGFTPEGQRVLEWARRIVGDTRAMREEINSLRHGLTGRLRIAAIPTALAMVAAGANRIGTSSGVGMVTCLGPGPLPLAELLRQPMQSRAAVCTCGTCPCGGGGKEPY